MKPFATRIAICGLAAFLPISGFAQEGSDPDPSQISREQWQNQVRTARERSETIRRQRRHSIPQLPTPEELAEEASRRALEDNSLRPGDVISTNRGLFRFQGLPERERKPNDFIRIR